MAPEFIEDRGFMIAEEVPVDLQAEVARLSAELRESESAGAARAAELFNARMTIGSQAERINQLEAEIARLRGL